MPSLHQISENQFFYKVTFKKLQTYLKTSIFFSLLFAFSWKKENIFSVEYGLVLAWKHRFTFHLWISAVPPEHSKD